MNKLCYIWESYKEGGRGGIARANTWFIKPMLMETRYCHTSLHVWWFCGFDRLYSKFCLSTSNICTYTHTRHRDTHTYRRTDRWTDRHTHTETPRLIRKYTHTHTQTHVVHRCKTLIGVHEMHSGMHPRSCNIFLAHDPVSSSAYPLQSYGG